MAIQFLYLLLIMPLQYNNYNLPPVIPKTFVEYDKLIQQQNIEKNDNTYVNPYNNFLNDIIPRFGNQLDDDQQISTDISDNIINTANQFVGGNYSWGGSTPKTGFDCSGLVQYVFKQNGINLPRTTFEQIKGGKEIKKEDLQPGDLIFQMSGNKGHVQIISNINDNGSVEVIEAKGKKDGIIRHNINLTDSMQFRRYINTNNKMNNSKEFTETMYPIVYKSLKENGIDADEFATIVTAQLAYESGWGKSKLSKDYNNFGGIKALKGRDSVSLITKEGNNGEKTVKVNFTKFNSIQDFMNTYINLLKNKFNAFNGTKKDFVSNIKSNGYFTLSQQKYQNNINNISNKIKSYIT